MSNQTRIAALEGSPLTPIAFPFADISPAQVLHLLALPKAARLEKFDAIAAAFRRNAEAAKVQIDEVTGQLPGLRKLLEDQPDN